MTIHTEERRIAGLLRELILQKGASMEEVEADLGWERGRLADLLEGRTRLGFDELLAVLPTLKVMPGEFFAWLYGFEPKSSGTAAEVTLEGTERTNGSSAWFHQQVLDRRFEESRRVVREAVARRAAWKQQRAEAAKTPSPLPEATAPVVESKE
jgi:transcriptional regulator with XRE-family HTH domain